MLIKFIPTFLLLTFSSQLSTAAGRTPSQSIRLIQEFSDLYSNKFVILIKPKNEAGGHFPGLTNIRNAFSRSLEFYTSIQDFTSFFRYISDADNEGLGMTTVYTHLASVNIRDLNSMLEAEYKGMLTWLCEIPTGESIPQLKDVSAPLDSKFFLVNWVNDSYAKIFEMYEIPRRPHPEVRYYGEWGDEDGLVVEEKDLMKRRQNLQGTITRFFTYNHRDSSSCRRGLSLHSVRYFFECYYMRRWTYLGKYLNYTTEFINYETSEEGNLMVDEVSKGNCDSGPMAVAFSRQRMKLVKFMQPKGITRVSLLVAVAGNEISLSSFFKPFAPSFWAVLAVWLSFTGFILASFRYVVDRLVCRKESSDHFANFYVPFQAICSQGCKLETPWTGLRIVLFICYVIPVIMLTAYSGGIVSSLSQPENIPFTTLKQFEENGEYKLTTIKALFPSHLLKVHPTFERSRQKSLVAENLPKDTDEAFRDLCTKKFVLLEAMSSLAVRAPKCKVYYLDDGQISYFVAMIFSPHFPVKEHASRYAIKVKERGLNFKDIYKIAISEYNFEFLNPDSLGRRISSGVSLNPAALENLTLPYTILLTGMCLSMVVLLAEIGRTRMG